MVSIIRVLVAAATATTLVVGPSGPALAGGGPAGRPATGPAPGAPGIDQQYLPADKSGFVTSATTGSTVWVTVQRAGGLGEIFYPDLGTPSARALQFVVADRPARGPRRRRRPPRVHTDAHRRAQPELPADVHRAHRRWRLTALRHRPGPRHRARRPDVHARGRPTRSTPSTTRRWPTPAATTPAAPGRALLADRRRRGQRARRPARVRGDLQRLPPASATAGPTCSPTAGWTGTTPRPAAGNLVQTAAIGAHRPARPRPRTLALGFGADRGRGARHRRAALRRGFGAAARAYARGWHAYLDGLDARRRAARPEQRQLYRVSAMVLAASEDKTHRGAYVAAPAAPWAFGRDDPSGPYHLVWSRDLYQIATALIAAGDPAGAEPGAGLPLRRAAEAGRLVPAELAGRRHAGLGRPAARRGGAADRAGLPARPHRRRAPGPRQAGGRLPARLRAGRQPGAVDAAGALGEPVRLLAGHDRRRDRRAGLRGHDRPGQRRRGVGARYLATADDWQARVKDWTVTSTGPYSPKPYFLRLTKDGNPDAGTTYDIGDSGPADVDQRRVVDPSFLDLVRLGVLPAGDPAVVNTPRRGRRAARRARPRAASSGTGPRSTATARSPTAASGTTGCRTAR